MGKITFKKLAEIPFCAMSLTDMTWHQTGTWRYLRPRYTEQIPSCQAHCPTSNNIEAWIQFIKEKNIEKAWETITLENPFPSIMGRICYHPCQNGCNRIELGGSVSIQMLERSLADMCQDKKYSKPFFPLTNKKIAVIGSGPAGLSCAYHLTRLGHNVTVFEKESKPGGMLRYGIPEFRLSKNILDNEIKRLKDIGIKFNLGKPIKDAVEMQQLSQNQFDAIFLAIGAHKSKKVEVLDTKNKNIISALDFLNLANKGKAPSLGTKVLVIGGGNTAIDAARTAIRMGSDVKILYRRSKNEMGAFDEEVKDAIEEGISIEYLILPQKVLTKDQKLTSLVCSKAKLTDPDESGKRRAVPIEDSEIIFETNAILYAIGEEIDNTIVPSSLKIIDGALETKLSGQTDRNNIFAGGDFINQPRTVVDALSSGKRSAIAIDCMFRKKDFEEIFQKLKIENTNYIRMQDYINFINNESNNETKNNNIYETKKIIKFTDLNKYYFSESTPNFYPKLDVKERLSKNNFCETLSEPSKEIIEKELERCFHCGRCIGCDNCFIYCPDVSIIKKSNRYDIDYNYCKGCGVCVTECPRAAMEMIEEEPYA